MRITIVAAAVTLALAAAVSAPVAAQGTPARPVAEKQKQKERGAQAREQGQRPERATAPGQARAQEGARGQGRGQAARAQGQGQGQGQARGQEARAQNPGDRGRGGPPAHARARRGGPAPDVAAFNRDLVSRAAAVRGRRHGEGKRVLVREQGDQLRVVRSDGRMLFALDREDAQRLGYWRVAVAPAFTAQARRDERDRGGIFDGLGDAERREEAGAPSFCRSGEGHPVWGREWCVDKGFGLGDDAGVWGRIGDLDDVVIRRPRTDRRDVDGGTLADILGDVVFGRLALQSLVLGADEPLSGRWIGEEDGPRVLRIRAGDLEVAELVDADRDERVDVLLVNLGD